MANSLAAQRKQTLPYNHPTHRREETDIAQELRLRAGLFHVLLRAA